MATAKAPLNLIETWLAVELVIPGMSIAQAVRDLNEELGANHSPQRLNEWRRGDRAIPQPVQDYMLRVGISHAIGAEIGKAVLLIDDDALDRIAARLTPPERKV